MTSSFEDEAIAIGRRLTQDAIWHGDRCTWMSRDLQEVQDPLGRGPAVRSMDANLYSGVAGVAWFLANLATLEPDEAFSRTAKGAVRQAMHLAGLDNGSSPNWEAAAHPSFYTGGLGIAWSAAEVSRLTGDDAMAKDVDSALQAYATKRPVPRRAKDLMGGNAGAILACLALQDRTVADLGPYVDALAKDLEAHEVRDGRGLAWAFFGEKGVPEPPLTGLSHGASGIAWTYLVLAQARKEGAYIQKALEGLDFETHSQLPDGTNWIDYRSFDTRPIGGPASMVAWCHGAPGIGLQRKMAHAMLPPALASRDLATAMGTTAKVIEEKSSIPDWSFTYCHGLSGLLDCWIEMSGADQTVIARAKDLTRTRVELFGESTAGNRTWGQVSQWPMFRPGYLDLSLMKGLAGIGHFMLRLSNPKAFPTILLGPPELHALACLPSVKWSSLAPGEVLRA